MVHDWHDEWLYCVKTNVFGGFLRLRQSNRVMGDDELTESTEDEQSENTETSFQERVKEIQERRFQAREDKGEMPREGQMQEMMGGGASSHPGMGGGNPLAQMMGGMMGGGSGGPRGAGSPPEMDDTPREGDRSSKDNQELTREVRKARDELHDIRRTLERIADAIEES
jgi:hypothetical protein